jgi:mono/diheme cytochrome c family protein
MTTRWLTGGVFALVLPFATAVGARGQEIKHESAPVVKSVEGADNYKAYCQQCHGAKMKGDGPAAKALNPKPADLTTIAKRNGGNFSERDVTDVILGNAHHSASSEMPKWAPVFRAVSGDDNFAKLRTANLVEYIKDRQVK